MTRYLITIAAMTLPGVALAQTTMTVRTVDVITSERARVGDPLTFSVDGEPNAVAYGSVINVEKRGSAARSGSVTVQVRYVRNGEQRVPVNGLLLKEARASTGTRIAAAGLGGIFIKGKHAVIDAGTAINVTVEE